jgi:hypothetical protein
MTFLKLTLAAIAVAAVALAQQTATSGAKDPVLEPPKDDQLAYLKEIATYKSIDADMQKALRTASEDKALLQDEQKRVESALAAMRASCGDKYDLDDAQFRQGIMVCSLKPPPTAAAAH